MTSKTFSPRKNRPVEVTRRVEVTRGALREALNEMGFGQRQPTTAVDGAAWQAIGLNPLTPGCDHPANP